MTLISCAECGKSIWDTDDACSGCGAPPIPARMPSPVVSVSVGSQAREPSPSQSRPVLWSPTVITLLAIPLGIIWGTVLIALNWHSLRKHGAATLTWVLGLLFGFFVQQPLVSIAPYPWPYLIGPAIWFPLFGLPQILYLRRHSTERAGRSWILPVSVGIAAQAILLVWTAADSNSERVSPTSLPRSGSASPLTTEEASRLLGPRVLEVWTSWREPNFIFWTKEGGSAGSAVVLRSTTGELRLITNRHVVQAPKNATEYLLRIRFQGELLPASVLAVAKDGGDLALLTCHHQSIKERFEMPIAPLKSIVPGQQCIALGNALGAGQSTTSGIVSRIDEVGGRKMIRTSAPISPGNSGGGLFALEDGRLLGITTSSITGADSQNVNLVIPTDYFTGWNAWDYLTTP